MLEPMCQACCLGRLPTARFALGVSSVFFLLASVDAVRPTEVQLFEEVDSVQTLPKTSLGAKQRLTSQSDDGLRRNMEHQPTSQQSSSVQRRIETINGWNVDHLCFSVGLVLVTIRWMLVQWPVGSHVKIVWLILKMFSPATSSTVVLFALGYMSYSALLFAHICEEFLTALFALFLVRLPASELHDEKLSVAHGQRSYLYMRPKQPQRPWLSPIWIIILGFLDILAFILKTTARLSLPIASTGLFKSFALPMSLGLRSAGLGKEQSHQGFLSIMLLVIGTALCGYAAVFEAGNPMTTIQHLDNSAFSLARTPSIGLVLICLATLAAVLQGQCKEFLIHNYHADGNEVQRLASSGSCLLSIVSLGAVLLIGGNPTWASADGMRTISAPILLRALWKAVDNHSGVKMTQVADYTWKKSGGLAQVVGVLVLQALCYSALGDGTRLGSIESRCWDRQAWLALAGTLMMFLSMACQSSCQ